MIKIIAFVLPMILLCGTYATAQVSTSDATSTRFAGNWSNSTVPDVTLTGLIQQVSTASSPAGLHIIVGTPQGPLDVAAGPFISPTVREQLSVGSQIQVTGKVETVNGKNFLFAKQFILSGQKIAVRTDRGALIHNHANVRTRSQSGQNGAL
jgi:hypothetical protein